MRKKRKKVLLFREMLDPQMSRELDLDKLSISINNQEYFFTEKKLNKNYEFGPFEIFVEKAVFQQSYIILPIQITCEGLTHRMFLAYDSDENIHYGTEMGQEGIVNIQQLLGHRRFQMLDEVTSEIIDDLIPEDFWIVRGYSN